jgi:uncharacterized integral membrane protein
MSDERPNDGIPIEEETFEEPQFSEPVPKHRRDLPPAVNAGTEVPFGLILFLIISVLVVLFTVQNTQDVELRFMTWEGEFPLALVIAGVVAVTVILDEIMGLVLRRRRRKRLAEKRELKALREQNK